METFLFIAAFLLLLIDVISIIVGIEKLMSKRRKQAMMPIATEMGFSEVSTDGLNIKVLSA